MTLLRHVSAYRSDLPCEMATFVKRLAWGSYLFQDFLNRHLMKKISVTSNLDWILTNKKTSILLLFCRDTKLLKGTILCNRWWDQFVFARESSTKLGSVQEEQQSSGSGRSAGKELMPRRMRMSPLLSPATDKACAGLTWCLARRYLPTTQPKLTADLGLNSTRSRPKGTAGTLSIFNTQLTTTTDTGAPARVPGRHNSCSSKPPWLRRSNYMNAWLPQHLTWGNGC